MSKTEQITPQTCSLSCTPFCLRSLHLQLPPPEGDSAPWLLSHPPTTGLLIFLELSQMAIGVQWVKYNKPEGTWPHGEGTQFKEDSKYPVHYRAACGAWMWLSAADFGLFRKSWKFRLYVKSVSGF